LQEKTTPQHQQQQQQRLLQPKQLAHELQPAAAEAQAVSSTPQQPELQMHAAEH
jgi:hypothetical protein